MTDQLLPPGPSPSNDHLEPSTLPQEGASALLDDEPPHEWLDCVTTDDGWRALGVSVRGFDHEDADSPRDDAATLAVVGSWLICAVADGVGSATFSRFGAHAAANAAVAKVAEELRRMSQPFDGDQLMETMQAGLTAALSAMHHEAEKRGCPLSSTSTTLLIVIHGHDMGGMPIVVTAQVGDGAIVAFASGGDESPEFAFVQLATPDMGYSGGETLPFNALDPTKWHQRIQVFDLPRETVGVLLMTDGISDAFMPWPQHMWRLMKFLRQHVTPVESVDDALTQLRATIAFDRPGMGDDRTLVVIHGPF